MSEAIKSIHETEPKPEELETTEKPAYEPPQVLKKRSVSRVTLFSGGGVAAGGLTANG